MNNDILKILVDEKEIDAATTRLAKEIDRDYAGKSDHLVLLGILKGSLPFMAVLMKNVSTYQKTKPVYDAYRKAKNKEKYRAGQERAIILHEAAARSLKAAGVVKLPNLDALQAEYEKLQTQKEALYADYGKLKKQVREYDVIKQNIDSILQAEKQPEREKETERG